MSLPFSKNEIVVFALVEMALVAVIMAILWAVFHPETKDAHGVPCTVSLECK